MTLTTTTFTNGTDPYASICAEKKAFKIGDLVCTTALHTIVHILISIQFNLDVPANNSISLTQTVPRVTLIGENSLLGRTMVIMSKGYNCTSDTPTADLGIAIAQCVIGVTNTNTTNNLATQGNDTDVDSKL